MSHTEETFPSGRNTHVLVFMHHAMDLTGWGRDYRDGVAWEATPYGYGRAAENFTVSWHTSHRENRVSRLFRKLIFRFIGFDFVHAWRNRESIMESDVVWTHTEYEHLAVAALIAISPGRKPRPKLISQTVWLWGEWKSESPWRKFLYTRLLERADVEVVNSLPNLEISKMAAPGRFVCFIPFGAASLEDWSMIAASERPDPPVVVAPGNDRHRDWKFFARVAELLPAVQFRVFSRTSSAREANWPMNAKVIESANPSTMRDAYFSASVVALPLVVNSHASGATVATESKAFGVPVVATNVGGIDPYVEGPGGFLTAAGDEEAFAAAIQRAIDEPVDPGLIAAARAKRGLTPQDYVRRLEWITLALVNDEQIPTFVSEFRSIEPLP